MSKKQIVRPNSAPVTTESYNEFSLSAIETQVHGTHSNNLSGIERTRERLETHRANVQRVLRLLDGQVELYDRLLQLGRARSKEISS